MGEEMIKWIKISFDDLHDKKHQKNPQNLGATLSHVVNIYKLTHKIMVSELQLRTKHEVNVTHIIPGAVN